MLPNVKRKAEIIMLLSRVAMVNKKKITVTHLNIKLLYTAGNRHKQNNRFYKEIREDNFRFWWRRVNEEASKGMYMSKIEIFFFTARILQNQRMLCCGECFHD